MATTYNTVTVGSTATQILSSNNIRKSFSIYNNGANIVYVGLDNGVLTTTGIPILPQASWTQNGTDMWKGNVWGITSSSTSDVRYWDTGA